MVDIYAQLREADYIHLDRRTHYEVVETETKMYRIIHLLDGTTLKVEYPVPPARGLSAPWATTSAHGTMVVLKGGDVLVKKGRCDKIVAWMREVRGKMYES